MPEKSLENANGGASFIGDLPRAEEAALKAFTEIPDNTYQYGYMGKSRQQEESMTCECHFDHSQHFTSSFRPGVVPLNFET
jgi:histone-lysine N-methyltransferase SETD2